MKISFKSVVVALFLAVVIFACRSARINEAGERQQIAAMLDSFNRHAATANYNAYFNHFTEDGVFIGTDATEHWNKSDFMVWAKPYFDRGRAWNFTALERHIYFGESGKIAWFDELLNTQMKICRGSGVVVKQGNEWKVKQYVLSMTVPNDVTNTVVAAKGPIEDSLITILKRK